VPYEQVRYVDAFTAWHRLCSTGPGGSMRSLLILTTTLLLGCHDVCGSQAPFWVVADCATTDTGDSALVECDVMVAITVDDASATTASADQDVTLTGTIENVSGRELTLTVANPCPDGLVTFDGLGDGYDYYGSCQAGDCLDSGEPVAYTLVPGETLVETVTIATGGDSCNAALSPQDYVIGGDLPLIAGDTANVCTLRAQLDIPQ
jgi:hypothetical protein